MHIQRMSRFLSSSPQAGQNVKAKGIALRKLREHTEALKGEMFADLRILFRPYRASNVFGIFDPGLRYALGYHITPRLGLTTNGRQPTAKQPTAHSP